MTKSGILAIVLLSVVMASSVFALELAGWKYQAEVTVEDGTSEYGGLILTPEVYNAARLDLADIRLVDADGQQMPYVLAKPKDITESRNYQPAVINRSISADRAAMITLDFGKQVVKNSLEVVTRGNNFRRAVKVEGSNDNIEFFTVVEQAYVFAISYRRRFEQVDLPANDYRYLRISVLPMAEGEKSPVINEVRAFKTAREPAKRQLVEMVHVEHSEDEKSSSSIYVYDLAYRRLPVSEIELDVADDSFYRYVTLEGRDAATRKVKLDSEDNRQRFREVEVNWERIISDAIYRYTTADRKKREKLVLRLPSEGRVYRYLRITIRNYDDKPVTVQSASAKMITHMIVFAAEDNAAATLYVGSESARPPRYDLKQRLNRPLQVKTRLAKLGNIADNPLFGQVEEKPVAWTEKHKVLLLIILVAIVLVLGWFILKSFKSIQNEDVQN
ncbi:MAG: DUF3999 family protein [Planctomycetota bacterium]